MPQLSLHSPVGDITISEEDGAIVSVDWGWGAEQTPTPLLMRAKNALENYFDGEKHAFDLPVAPSGTPFQTKVWTEMRRIPFGKTRSYGDIARQLGTSPRAIGTACGRNPIPILIPCHRVVGKNGDLTGYSAEGGLATKATLLRLEADAG